MPKLAVPDLPVTTKRIIRLIDYMIENKIVEDYDQAEEKLGLDKGRIEVLKSGDGELNLEHVKTACEITGASADYIFGFTDLMMRKRPEDPLEAMKEAVYALQEKFK